MGFQAALRAASPGKATAVADEAVEMELKQLLKDYLSECSCTKPEMGFQIDNKIIISDL